MAKDQRRRQKALERQAAKRKAKQRAAGRHNLTCERMVLDEASDWPLHECRVSRNWKDPTSLCQILVARKAPESKFAVAAILVDLACLGAKSGFVHVLDSADECDTFAEKLFSLSGCIVCDISLAAKIVATGVDFAKSLGINPSKDARKAIRMLGNADPAGCTETVRVGDKDGRPFFTAGPDDNVPKIIDALNRTVGPGNFGYVFKVPDIGPSLLR